MTVTGIIPIQIIMIPGTMILGITIPGVMTHGIMTHGIMNRITTGHTITDRYIPEITYTLTTGP